MHDWEDLMKQGKEDVLCAINVWSSLLEETFGSRLEYAYAKGSAVKNWNSPVDYVPVISDLDIHVMMTDSKSLFPENKIGFNLAVNVSKKYEDRFREIREEYLHIPRPQVVHINPVLENPSFILPQVSDVHIMIGSPKDGPILPTEKIRLVDRKQIENLSEYLMDLPRQVFDRVGLDFWTLLRRMNWRVSPTPIRLLTQNHSNPIEVWQWNRTQIIKSLIDHNHTNIADSYRKFYDVGWELFLSAFTDYEMLREIIIHGQSVLQRCLDEITNYRI